MPIITQTERVEFDPSNFEHRKAVSDFMQRNAWADTPFRFKADAQFMSVAHQVQTKLLQWYLANEMDGKVYGR